MSDGEIFNTISHGKNTMMGYGDRIQVIDRWAIIAYLRALQKSQGGASLWPTCPRRSALNWSPNSMSQSFSDEPQPEFFDYKHVGGRFLGLIGMAVLAFAVRAGRGLLRYEAVRVLVSLCLHIFPYDLHGRTVLDACASRGGCRVERGRSASDGEYRQPAVGHGHPLYSASGGGADALEVDAARERARPPASREGRLPQQALLLRESEHLLRVLCRIVHVPALVSRSRRTAMVRRLIPC